MTVWFVSSDGNSSPQQHCHPEIYFFRRMLRSTMSWMSLSWREHFCQDDKGGRASPELPEVEDANAAGVAAMATAARLGRGEEIARKKKADSSGNSPS